jgi:hypothetical protein
LTACEKKKVIVLLLLLELLTCEHLNEHEDGWRYNPEDSHLHTRRREKIKSYIQTSTLNLPLFKNVYIGERGAVDFIGLCPSCSDGHKPSLN